MFNSLVQKFGGSGTSAFRKKAGPLVAPVLGPGFRFPYGAFQFKARLTKGCSFEVQASNDLKSWLTIVSDTAPDETIEYIDSEASKFSFRFYRMIAEELFSANVLGYATTVLPPGFSMIANPFDAPSNDVSVLFKDLPEGTKLNKFDTRFFQLTDNVLRNGKWIKPFETLSPGEGAILFNPTSDYIQLSFVGDVMQGNLALPIPGGFSVRSSLVPLPGRLHVDLGFPIADGDVVHLFDRDRQQYVLFPYDVAQWAANPPMINIAESFWVAKTSPGNWARTLTLNA